MQQWCTNILLTVIQHVSHSVLQRCQTTLTKWIVWNVWCLTCLLQIMTHCSSCVSISNGECVKKKMNTSFLLVHLSWSLYVSICLHWISIFCNAEYSLSTILHKGMNQMHPSIILLTSYPLVLHGFTGAYLQNGMHLGNLPNNPIACFCPLGGNWSTRKPVYVTARGGLYRVPHFFVIFI